MIALRNPQESTLSRLLLCTVRFRDGSFTSIGLCPEQVRSSPSRPGEFHPEPLTGRVEDWRAGVGRSLCSPLSRPFVCECHTISTVPRFQLPPRRTQHADFPHCALLFASPQGLWDLSCRGDFFADDVDHHAGCVGDREVEVYFRTGAGVFPPPSQRQTMKLILQHRIT
jgi:hypothetical protein